MSLRGDERIEIVVLFNASTADREFVLDTGEGTVFELHEVLKNSHDPIVRQSSYMHDDRTFLVPARTTAVFVAN